VEAEDLGRVVDGQRLDVGEVDGVLGERGQLAVDAGGVEAEVLVDDHRVVEVLEDVGDAAAVPVVGDAAAVVDLAGRVLEDLSQS